MQEVTVQLFFYAEVDTGVDNLDVQAICLSVKWMGAAVQRSYTEG